MHIDVMQGICMTEDVEDERESRDDAKYRSNRASFSTPGTVWNRI
jgi:hypothetical protein